MSFDMARLLAQAQDLPISVKTVLLCRGEILLLRQPDGRWELPGGKLEAEEHLIDCLQREVVEETGIAPTIHELLDTWVREKPDGTNRFVITFISSADIKPATKNVRLSSEHDKARFLLPDEAAKVEMLEGYVRACRLAREQAEKLAG